MTPLHLVILAASTPATHPATKSSGTNPIFFIVLALVAVVYITVLRPRQKRMREKQTKGAPLSVGDEVMSVGGIFGVVVEVREADLDVEVAPGTVLTFLRRAVNPRPIPRDGDTPSVPDEPATAEPFGGTDPPVDAAGGPAGHGGTTVPADGTVGPDESWLTRGQPESPQAPVEGGDLPPAGEAPPHGLAPPEGPSGGPSPGPPRPGGAGSGES